MQDFSGNTVRVAEFEERSPAAPETGGGAASGRERARLAELAGRHALRNFRLPMLDVALARLPALLAQRLSQSWQSRVEAELVESGCESFVETEKFGNESRLFGLFSVETPGCSALVAFEAPLVWRLLDCMLGGQGAGDVGRVRFSHLDRCLMQAVAEHAAGALTEAFAAAGGSRFFFQEWCDSAEALRPADAGEPFMRAGLRLRLASGEGRIDMVLPLAAFENVLDVLAAPDPGERLGQDAAWQRHLAQQVRRAQVDLAAVLYEGEAPLGQMRALRPGDSFSFGLPPDSPVTLWAEGRRLGAARLGRSGSRAAIRFETAIAGGRA